MHSLAKKLIKTELKQRREEGCDVDAIADRIAAALADGASEQIFSALYDELMVLPVSDAFPYVEPSELAEIQAQRPAADSSLGPRSAPKVLCVWYSATGSVDPTEPIGVSDRCC